MFQLSTNVFNQKGLSFMTIMIADISKRFRVCMASLTDNRVFVVQNRLAFFLGQNIFLYENSFQGKSCKTCFNSWILYSYSKGTTKSAHERIYNDQTDDSFVIHVYYK